MTPTRFWFTSGMGRCVRPGRGKKFGTAIDQYLEGAGDGVATSYRGHSAISACLAPPLTGTGVRSKRIQHLAEYQKYKGEGDTGN